MAQKRRPINDKDLENLETDSAGNLYWYGKRIRLAGFSVHDAAAWATVALVIVIALADWSDIWTTIQHII
jgi:hypothetical protein